MDDESLHVADDDEQDGKFATLASTLYSDGLMEKVFVVVDTNTFLHYRGLDQIAWSEIFSDQIVILLICPPVIRELNKHKDSPRTPKLRDRAATALRKIDAWSDLSSPVVLRDSAEVRFRIHDSTIDFSNFDLVRDITDDHLIAALIELNAETPSSSVVLLTKDTGLKLKARAHDFSVVSLPDSDLLPDEALPSEKKIKDLENQVRELQNVRPKLRLAFAGGSSNLNLRFRRTSELSESNIATRMTDIRKRYPRMVEQAEEAKVSGGYPELKGLLGIAYGFGTVNSEQIRRYNQDLEEFFGEYEQYLDELSDFCDWERRTAALEIVLVNEGTCPADDVDIFAHFPDGFELFEESECWETPEEPKAPRKPQSALTDFIGPSAIANVRNFYPSAHFDLASHITTPSNVSGPKIKRTNSYDVRVKVKRAKHGIPEPLDVMYLTFESLSAAQSFRISYDIHASNLPTRATGSLDVIV
jgi:rRNA-processing protein FCF1